jgi:hypothetical protein
MGSVGPMTDAAADSIFAKAKEAGIDALIMEVHGGNPRWHVRHNGFY